MKKIMSIWLVLLLIFSVFLSMTVSVQALNDVHISIGGEISKVQYSQTSNSELIHIHTSSRNIVRHYVLPPEGSIKYYRLIFEISDTSVPHTVRFDVNKGSVGQIRLANLSEPKRTNVVVEINKNPDYTLEPSSDGKAVVLTIRGLKGSTPSTPTPTPKPSPSATPTPKPSPSATPSPSNQGPSNNQGNPSSVIKENGPLSWEMSGDTCVITLKGTTLSNTTNASLPRFELREVEKILQITIPGKDTRFSDGFLSGNSIINGILINYSEKTNSTVIRISCFNNITYTTSVSNGNTVFNIKAGKAGSTPAPQPSTTPSPTPKPTPTPAPSKEPSEPSRGIPSSVKNIELGDGSHVALRLVNQGIV
ncbi:MAG: AMIN domain-containing protein, partial [Clostridiaceae bacterium]|nr:AMIN domain-containing protein [Clostridiaceae bacterium]